MCSKFNVNQLYIVWVINFIKIHIQLFFFPCMYISLPTVIIIFRGRKLKERAQEYLTIPIV